MSRDKSRILLTSTKSSIDIVVAFSELESEVLSTIIGLDESWDQHRSAPLGSTTGRASNVYSCSHQPVVKHANLTEGGGDPRKARY